MGTRHFRAAATDDSIGDDEARAAVYCNRNRLKSGVGKEAKRKGGEVAKMFTSATSFTSQATISAI
jgi:hypothetical protein